MKTFLGDKINRLKDSGLYRFMRTLEGDQGPEIQFHGRRYLNFSSNNYLGLANHPRLKEAAICATRGYGTGSGASRLITGSMSLHDELEKRVARFKGTESALVFNSGYHANLGVIPALVGSGDVIFSDELNHASLIDGCRLSKAVTRIYRHNDVGHLEELICRLSPIESQKLIVTDTVFSMDGDLCKLQEIMRLAEKHDAWVYVDEAHATGIFGETGRGLVEHFRIESTNPRLIQMGTLGKALGSFGAYVYGSAEVIDYLINRARTFIYTTALPPAVLAASMAAIDLISEDSSLRENLWKNVEYFKKGLEKILVDSGHPLGPSCGQSPIFPIIIGDTRRTMEISESLFVNGIWAHGIRPPTVAEGTSRIRLTLMATHTKEHLDRCLEELSKCLRV